jgi:hypothetical protein
MLLLGLFDIRADAAQYFRFCNFDFNSFISGLEFTALWHVTAEFD